MTAEFQDAGCTPLRLLRKLLLLLLSSSSTSSFSSSSSPSPSAAVLCSPINLPLTRGLRAHWKRVIRRGERRRYRRATGERQRRHRHRRVPRPAAGYAKSFLRRMAATTAMSTSRLYGITFSFFYFQIKRGSAGGRGENKEQGCCCRCRCVRDWLILCVATAAVAAPASRRRWIVRQDSLGHCRGFIGIVDRKVFHRLPLSLPLSHSPLFYLLIYLFIFIIFLFCF